MIWIAVGVDGRLGGRLIFHQGANDSEGGETEVLEGAGFRGCIQEGIEEERDVCCGSLVRVLLSHVKTTYRSRIGPSFRCD